MTAYGVPLNEDAQEIKTSAKYLDRGDGTVEWYHAQRIFDGGDVAQGAKADAAVTNPASSASIIALLKGLLTQMSTGATTLTKLEDAVAASGDAGIMSLAVRRDTVIADGAAGDYTPLHVDANGCLWVAENLPTITNVTTTAYATNLVVKASAGRLMGLQGYSSKATAQFILIHDVAALPADGQVPKIIIPVAATSPFSIDFGRFGRQFANGVVVCCSTTGPTKTIGSADIWVDAQVI